MSGIESVTQEYILMPYFLRNKLVPDNSFYDDSSVIDVPNKKHKRILIFLNKFDCKNNCFDSKNVDNKS